MTMGQAEKMLKRLVESGLDCADDEKSLFAASVDNMRYSFLPRFVVRAKSGDDVEKTMRAAYDFEVPVTVRGSGTGCAGGCVPTLGGAVLDLSGIDFIEIDPVSRVAHVGAGAVTAHIDAKANGFGLFYAPDPSSHKYSSIGGNIACNAGGLRALKYGTTREHVLSLAAVLADGRKISCGLPLKKYSVGQNLRDMFIGSEGTLGIVTEAWLKLLPLPSAKTAALAYFDDDGSAFNGIERIMRANLAPCVLEFMDTETVACVRARNPGLSVPENAAAILAEFDGERNETLFQARKFAETLSPFADAEFAVEDSAMAKLWEVRRSASQSMYELGDSKISQDIVLPNGVLHDFFSFYKDLGRSKKLATPVFGHAGDGNYHIHFMYDSSDAGARARALEAMDASIEKAVELGGAVSGEHGIGFLKSKYMPLQHGALELELMSSIKRLFDPKNILNPGKIYAPSDIEGLSPLKGLKLPWD